VSKFSEVSDPAVGPTPKKLADLADGSIQEEPKFNHVRYINQKTFGPCSAMGRSSLGVVQLFIGTASRVTGHAADWLPQMGALCNILLRSMISFEWRL
jgi:hypothetical protein